MSAPVTAPGAEVVIDLLAGFSPDQFVVNDWDGVREFWQVFDRTTGVEVPSDDWDMVDGGRVVVRGVTPWHRYTVNFLVTRIWEEISMYNHVTNDWGDREHLRAVEPRYPEVQERLLQALEDWCVAHPHTTVVRFTSLFYNFAWFWGDNPRLPHIYGDWGSYDFTVSPPCAPAVRRDHGPADHLRGLRQRRTVYLDAQPALARLSSVDELRR